MGSGTGSGSGAGSGAGSGSATGARRASRRASRASVPLGGGLRRGLGLPDQALALSLAPDPVSLGVLD